MRQGRRVEGIEDKEAVRTKEEQGHGTKDGRKEDRGRMEGWRDRRGGKVNRQNRQRMRGKRRSHLVLG